MIGIIVTGHGYFSDGLLSAIELVVGNQEKIIAVNFREGQSSEELKAAMEQAVREMETDEILIMADLIGGTPFNISAALKAEQTNKKIRLIAGVNMAAMVEAVFSRVGCQLDVLVDLVLNSGKEGFGNVDNLAVWEEGEAEFSGGI